MKKLISRGRGAGMFPLKSVLVLIVLCLLCKKVPEKSPGVLFPAMTNVSVPTQCLGMVAWLNFWQMWWQCASPPAMSRHCASLGLFWLSGAGHTDFILRFVISCEDLFTLRVFQVSRSEDRLTSTWGTLSSSLREPLGAEGWTPTNDRQAYHF